MKSSLLAWASVWWCLLLLCAPGANAATEAWTTVYLPITGLTSDACFASYSTLAQATTEFYNAAGCTVSSKNYKVMFSSYDGRWQFSPRNIVNGNGNSYVGRWQEGSYSTAISTWIGSSSTINAILFNGEWVMIGIPAPMILTKIDIASGNVVALKIYGNTVVGDWTELTPTSTTGNSITSIAFATTGSVYYNAFALVVSQVSSGTTTLTMSSITLTGKNCRPGTYEDTTDTGICTLCDAGKYWATEGSKRTGACTSCGTGKYSLTGASVCINCPAGKFRLATSGPGSADTDCTGCTAGKYSILTGLTADCTLICAAGKYSASGDSACSDCAAGTFSAAQAGSCTNCVTASVAGSSSCRDNANCPAGYFLDGAACNPCGVGKYTLADNMDNPCLTCNNGKYAPAKSSACYDCPAGSYGTGAICSCTACDKGKYGSTVGGTSSGVCNNCVEGKYSLVLGSTSITNCFSCPLGTYSATAASSACTDCAAGKYSSWAASVCTDCPAGKYSASAGSSACLDCAPGSTCAAGATTCGSCS
jgi:hypothetical protein